MKRVYVDPTGYLGRAACGDYAAPAWHDLALAALKLRRQGPRGELLALSALDPQGTPLSHQIEGAMAIVEGLGSVALLADDEALEPIKTAALVVREWALRYGSRALILAPAARLRSWEEALASWQGAARPQLIRHDRIDQVGRDLHDAVVIDGAHAILADERLRLRAGRLLLVTSTPIRSGLQDLVILLAMLGGTPDPAGLERHALRRPAPVPIAPRLAEIVRLEAPPVEVTLFTEARDLALSASRLGAATAATWSRLLPAAESLPAVLAGLAARELEREAEPLGRARILSLLKTVEPAAARSPGKFEALVPLLAGLPERTLVCVSSPEAAAWLERSLTARGLEVGTHAPVQVVPDSAGLLGDAADVANVVHLDTPWDPRGLARRLDRARGTHELRSVHLVLAGSLEEQLLKTYQESFALVAPFQEVASAVAEAPQDPEEAVLAALVEGDEGFSRWAATLRRCHGAAAAARKMTAQVLGEIASPDQRG